MSVLSKVALFLLLTLAAAGCDREVTKGKPLTDYIGPDALVIGLSSYTIVTKTNQDGRDIPGFVIDGVRIIRDRKDFEAAHCLTYGILPGTAIRDVVTRGLLEGLFWEQVNERRQGMGSAIYLLHRAPVVFVNVDDMGRIRDYETKRGAHFTISVNTNEF
jgi:hypothetical protein